AAGEASILLADQRCGRRRRALGVLGAVDESEQVTLVEGPEAMHLVDHLRVPTQSIRQPLGELEAQIESMGPDVEEQVARRRHRGVVGPIELGKGVKARRVGLAEETVPEPRAETDHAAELALGYAKAD